MWWTRSPVAQSLTLTAPPASAVEGLTITSGFGEGRAPVGRRPFVFPACYFASCRTDGNQALDRSAEDRKLKGKEAAKQVGKAKQGRKKEPGERKLEWSE